MNYDDAREDEEYLAALAAMGDLSNDVDDNVERPWSPSFSECSDHTYATMDWGRPRVGKNRNVFKGTALVSTLLEHYPRKFRSRTTAVRFSKRLFKEGLIRSIFGARTFEDSSQLFMWQDDDVIKHQRGTMTSSHPANQTAGHSVVQKEPRSDKLDFRFVEDVKNKVLNRTDNNLNIVASFNNFIQELERDFPEASHRRKQEISKYPPNTWETGVKRESTCSTDSSVDTQTYFKLRDRSAYRHAHPMAGTRDHSVIPEERAMDKPEMDYEMTRVMPGTINSHTSSGGTMESGESQRRWPEPSYPYSDNEKQLIEEMKRMKKEHQHILRTYEERINKLMAKMHELRSIAEMLENSSTKSSPYGILPPKASLLNIIGSKLEEERKQAAALTQDGDLPPPLPPRPTRGNKVYPNKPIVHPQVKMKALHWHRIILTDVGSESGTIWHSMLEPRLDTDEIERLFSRAGDASSSDDVSLYDDIYFRRGRPKQQPVGVFDSDKAQRVTLEMKKLRHPLNDIIQAMSSLDMSSLNKDGVADLLELIHTPRDVVKILHHIKRKGASNLDCPEYLIFELSKVDHFRERIDFLRFKHRLQVNLFEIDQQLRELNTACDEITNSVALKNLMETLLSIGNYMNGGSTERGQADGFTLDILNKLKDFSDRTRRGNLLEFMMKVYVQQYENDLDLGCPTRFRLPEPSNMRHAAQVSFDDMHRALSELRTEVTGIRERIESLSRRESSNLTQTLRVSSDNFATCALEVVYEQECVLEDSRNRFLKTTAYFLHDNRKCTPHEFFQIWATFLHDCKYYWKLAHRNLARGKFELEFRSKSQMSSSSGQGFSSVKSKMLKHLSVLNDHKDGKVNRAQHLKHINNWIESVGKYTQELKPERPPLPGREIDDNKEVAKYTQSYQRSQSPSPKPMTSTPPNVHKPLAINKTSPETVEQIARPIPAVRTANYENQPRYPANYENQDQAYESLNKARMNNGRSVQPVVTPGVQTQDTKKNGPFSLKSWLKRDQRSDDEQLQSPSQNTANSHSQPSKSTSSGNPFGKLRNTVVQKFTNGNSAKKSSDNQAEVTPSRRERETSRDRRAQSDAESSDRKHGDGRRSRKDEGERRREERKDREHRTPSAHGNRAPVPDPIQAFQERLNRDYQNYNYESPVSRTSTQSGNQSVPSTLSSVRSRDLSPSKYEVARAARDRHESGQRHPPPPTSEKPKHGANDENNNKNTAKVSPQSGSSYRTRDRAPIALGSNMSISDVYGRTHDEMTQNTVINGDATDAPHVSNVDSKWVKATAVPVYKAKLIPNYENQTKLDPRFDGQGIRGQAEPAVPAHLHQESTTSDDYRQILQRKSEMYLSTGYNTATKQMTPDPPRPSRTHKDSRRSVSAGNLPERPHLEQPQDPYPPHPSSDKRPDVTRSHQRDSLERTAAGHGGGPTNAPSISSLIEKFEKRHDEGSLTRQHDNAWQMDTLRGPSELQGMPVSMSTPVTRRRNIGNYEDPQTPPHVRSDRGRYHDTPNSKQSYSNAHHTHVSAPMSQYSNYQGTPASAPPPKPAHTAQHRAEHGEAYTDQLRKAAKTSSVFDRYAKPSPPGYGRHGSPGAMAVVKPTVVHQGPVTFMEI